MRLRYLAVFLAALPACGQWWDRGGEVPAWLKKTSDNKFSMSFEERIRYEDRRGIGFGKDGDEGYVLLRTRLGMTYRPVNWLKVSAMAQDSRAPGYPNASNSYRDALDLQEAFVELFGDRKKGVSVLAGRSMINYGEGRLIGSPQWGNVSRTWDIGRVTYKAEGWSVDVLVVSPVKVRSDAFNKAVFGDRIWGVYGSAPKVAKRVQYDLYFLRHEQNWPGGYSGGNKALGTDRLGVNAYGFRASGPLGEGLKYNMEGVFENGKVGAAGHLAGGYYGGLSRRWTVAGRPLDVSGEYKYASGTDNPADLSHNGTFDQFYPANHDKFGHEDLIGWRNIHNLRSLATLAVNKRLALNAMYDTYWLASAKDSLYNGAGRPVSRSAAGTAGRHVGQEADLFATLKVGKRWTVGGGYAYFFAGEFIRKTTPGVGPTYLYFFHTYSF
ncbi:MAG: alginate export family protein [Acidobacteria bacterium]|nr:alginate export family protein [Acidobacteriota bacterium]